MNQTSKNISIGSVLISLLFGVVAGVLAYKYMDYPLIYTDFIAGSVTWGGEGKSKDVSMIFGFMFLTLLSLFGLSQFQAWIKNQYDEKIANIFSIVLLYSSIPFVIWVGEQVLSKRVPTYSLLFFNAWIVLGGLITTFITLSNNDIKDRHKDTPEVITFAFVTFVFASIAPNVITVLLMKVGIQEKLEYAWIFTPILWFIGLYLFKNKAKYYQYSILLFQLLIIGYFSLLIPSPYITEGSITFFPVQNTLYIVLALLIAVGIYDIYKRFKQHANTTKLSFSLLSPFPLAAILLLTFLSTTAMPNVSADDYHYGEKLLPLYMVSKYQIIPYADYVFAHGFIDMLPAIGNSLFLDGSAATFNEGNRILTALIIVTSFVVAYHYVGLLVAFLLSLLIIPIGIWYFIAVIMSLTIMKVKIERLGVSFFLISLVTFLLAPGQGTVFIVAILPLVLYRAWSTQTVAVNLKSTGTSFLLLIAASLVMPWILDMILAAVNYVLENGPINFQAYGVAWHLSWNSDKTINSSLVIFETIRTAWVFVPVFILVFWLLGYYKDKKKAFFYGLFAVIFLLIMYKYSLGRIDQFHLTRLGKVTKMAVPLMFLSVYFLNFSKQKFAYWTLFFTFWMGLLTPSYIRNPIKNATIIITNLGILTKGEEIDIPRLGNARTNTAHINRTVAIKKIADQFLDENETFVDLTNRGGLYFYLERRMPIEAAPYNQPHSNMQQRSIDRLSKNPPPMALLKADNKNFDGKSISIRTHQLYRWVMDNYIPVKIGDIIIGVHRNEMERFKQRFENMEVEQTIYSETSNITDNNWVSGVSRHTTTILVPRTPVNEMNYGKIKTVEFVNGDIRNIESIYGSKRYIKINLTGKKMPGNIVGYPNKIKSTIDVKIYLPKTEDKKLELWDKVFLLKNLHKLPISWGNSQNTLNKKMTTIQNIDFAKKGLNNVKEVVTGKFQVTGKMPYIVYNISQYNLSGKEAGLLSFDFTCNNIKPKLEVYWSADANPMTEKAVVRFNADSGHMIVPLDAMPRWLNAKHLTKIRIGLPNQYTCKIFTIKNVDLSQRALYVH